MDKKDVIEFFDSCASGWDAAMIKDDKIIGKILDNAHVEKGIGILDVACGTGVLFPYYLDLGVGSVTGIDISPEMAKIAAEKFKDDPRVQVLCGDVEAMDEHKKYDVIVVYNAFPHFPDPRKLIRTLAAMLKEGGRLTIAHGQSREAIDGHHQGSASKVSNGLMPADSLKKIFDSCLQVEVMICDDRMYQVSGVKAGHSHAGHTHSHEHSHGQGDTPMDEMLALMRFMVNHNDAHAQELAELAQQLHDAGKTRAYGQIMGAVSDFDMVNAKLSGIADSLAQ